MEYTEMMLEAKFEQGVYSACAVYHKDKNVRVAVHGHDFKVLGPSKSLEWLRGVVQQRIEIKLRELLVRGTVGASVRILTRT